MAPAAAGDPPLPYERRMASRSLDAHIEKANVPPSPLQTNEDNLLAGAKVYKEQCAVCHGLPNQPPPAVADNMYPHATLMLKDKGETEDPPPLSYSKPPNEIRSTVVPHFTHPLTQ